jgi:hypothetical protein
MEIATRAAEEKPTKAGQNRIAKIAMERRHCARLNTAFEAVPHHEFIAGSKPLHEGVQFTEIVTVVAITHDNEPTVCGSYPGKESVPVPLIGNLDYRGPMTYSDIA